jgi:hypothetical protein
MNQLACLFADYLQSHHQQYCVYFDTASVPDRRTLCRFDCNLRRGSALH